MVYYARSDWSNNHEWIQYTHIDGVIESYARSDWLKCFDEYYIKQIDSIFSCVCTLIDAQKTSKCGENNSHATRLRLVAYFFVLATLWRHLCIDKEFQIWVHNLIYNLVSCCVSQPLSYWLVLCEYSFCVSTYPYIAWGKGKQVWSIVWCDVETCLILNWIEFIYFHIIT